MPHLLFWMKRAGYMSPRETHNEDLFVGYVHAAELVGDRFNKAGGKLSLRAPRMANINLACLRMMPIMRPVKMAAEARRRVTQGPYPIF